MWAYFLWAEDELTFDNANVKKDRLYQLNLNMTFDGNEFTMNSTPRPMAATMKDEIPGIANTARYSNNDEHEQLLFSFANKKSLYAKGHYADASLFSMFTFDFIEGSAANPFPQLYSLVITESTKRKFLAVKKNVIGKTVRVDNKAKIM